MLEQTGHGVPKIVSVYRKHVFELGDNNITVKIPFAFEPTMVQTNYDGLSKSHAAVLKIIRENPLGTTEEFAKSAGLDKTRVSQIIAYLKNMGKLERIGGKKSGYWKTKSKLKTSQSVIFDKSRGFYR